MNGRVHFSTFHPNNFYALGLKAIGRRSVWEALQTGIRSVRGREIGEVIRHPNAKETGGEIEAIVGYMC